MTIFDGAASQFPEDNGPMAHPIRPESYIVMDNFYTSTVYRKGAEVPAQKSLCERVTCSRSIALILSSVCE